MQLLSSLSFNLGLAEASLDSQLSRYQHFIFCFPNSPKRKLIAVAVTVVNVPASTVLRKEAPVGVFLADSFHVSDLGFH